MSFRPRGEICFRGHNVFQGYHKDPAKTAEVLDSEGWLHTGDIGIINETGKVNIQIDFDEAGRLIDTLGSISIVDRKKNIFKLSQGEYVVPDRIEAVLVKSRLTQQVYLHGDSLQPYLVIVGVLNHENFIQAYPGCGGQSAAEICNAPSTNAAILAEYTKLCKAAGLKGFEAPKAVYVTPDLFSVENGLLTPTFKVKRKEAHAAFKDPIEKMFQTLKEKEDSSGRAKL